MIYKNKRLISTLWCYRSKDRKKTLIFKSLYIATQCCRPIDISNYTSVI